MTALSDWLHKLPAPQVQALRDFRSCARAAYPNDRNYLATALDAGNIDKLLEPMARPEPFLTPVQAATFIATAPRELILLLRI
jgi:hypothetical protein